MQAMLVRWEAEKRMMERERDDIKLEVSLGLYSPI